ncbi:uncharacterized protein METZ01_LOCUS162456 [marine metagenome]|uniref:Cytochrome c domain-containing protein n=1 Tax=marine metagenome TaxID=408172 RepID=A0A382B8I6_9ZZZZ
MFRRTLQLGAGIALGLVCGQVADLAAQENPFTTAYDVGIGSRIFERSCSRCHGLDGTGGERGPDLTSGFQRASTDAGLFNVVRNGVPDTEMTGIGQNRGDQSVWQIVSYLQTLSGGMRVNVPGDPVTGASVYAQSDCADCHVIDGVGSSRGPDLTTIGSRRSPSELVSDLTDPDERVQPQWWMMNVTHNDGTRVEGRRLNEGTYSVRILDESGRMWSFEKRNLSQSERVETSTMPSYAENLTDDQMQDLVAYLYGLIRPDEG